MADPGFQLSVDDGDGDGRRTLALRGELDIATAPALRDALADVGGAGLVVVDVGELGFIDSAGLGVLARAAVTLGDSGVRLVLARPSATVRRLVAVTKLEQWIEVVDELP